MKRIASMLLAFGFCLLAMAEDIAFGKGMLKVSAYILVLMPRSTSTRMLAS